jgi:hypothetical protein
MTLGMEKNTLAASFCAIPFALRASRRWLQNGRSGTESAPTAMQAVTVICRVSGNPDAF